MDDITVMIYNNRNWTQRCILADEPRSLSRQATTRRMEKTKSQQSPSVCRPISNQTRSALGVLSSGLLMSSTHHGDWDEREPTYVNLLRDLRFRVQLRPILLARSIRYTSFPVKFEKIIAEVFKVRGQTRRRTIQSRGAKQRLLVSPGS